MLFTILFRLQRLHKYTRRPLQTLTSADIGISSDHIEENLTFYFNTARDRGAIVLIDEADIYMEVCVQPSPSNIFTYGFRR